MAVLYLAGEVFFLPSLGAPPRAGSWSQKLLQEPAHPHARGRRFKMGRRWHCGTLLPDLQYLGLGPTFALLQPKDPIMNTPSTCLGRATLAC